MATWKQFYKSGSLSYAAQTISVEWLVGISAFMLCIRSTMDPKNNVAPIAIPGLHTDLEDSDSALGSPHSARTRTKKSPRVPRLSLCST